MSQAPQTITIDDVVHEVARFSAGVQQAVAIYNSFQADLNKAQLEVIKNQSALASISTQIADAVRKELAEQKKAEAANEEKVAE